MIGWLKKSSFAGTSWSASAAFVVVALTVIIPLMILLSTIGMAKLGILPSTVSKFILGDGVASALTRIVMSIAIEVGLLFGVKRRYKLKLADFGLRRFNVWRALLTILTLFVLFVAVLFVVYLLVSVLLPQINLNETQKSGFELGRRGAGLIGSFIVSVLIAPFIEEVYFRGFLLPPFSAKWGNFAGVILSSALFGAMHMQVNVGIYTFILGVILSIMYIRFRSIGPGIILHTLNNSIAFFVLLNS